MHFVEWSSVNQRRSSMLGPEAPEPDRFLEIIETAGEFVRERAVPIMFGAGALVLAVVLGVWWSNQRQNARVDEFAALYSAGNAIQNASSSDDEALAEASAALEKAGDSPEAVFLKAKASLLQEEGGAKAAEQFLEAAQKEAGPRALYAQLNYGLALEKAGRLDEALSALADAALDRFRGKAAYERALTEAQTARARIHTAKGEHDSARAAHQRIVDRYLANRDRALEQASDRLVQKTLLLLETQDASSSADSVARAYGDLLAWVSEEMQKPESERRRMADVHRLLKEIETHLSGLAAAKRSEARGKASDAAAALNRLALPMSMSTLTPSFQEYERALLAIAEIDHTQKQ